MMKRQSERRRAGTYGIAVLATAPIWGLCVSVWASPNLVANGDLEQPRALARVRPGATESEVVFEFAGEMNFGRVIARARRAGTELGEQMSVGYSAQPGSSRGLIIDAREVKVEVDYDIEVWFDLKGKIRPNRQYAYSVQCVTSDESQNLELRMVAPAVWADGQFMGATVDLKWSEDDNTYDKLAKRGVLKSPNFRYQTGGQYLILKLPKKFGKLLFIQEVGLRELDNATLQGEAAVMPTPLRYVGMNDPLEDRIEEVFDRTAESLKNALGPQGYWRGGGDLDTSVELTAVVLNALAGRGESLTEKNLVAAVKWLADQEVNSTHALSARLTFLSHYFSDEHRKTIASDLLKLIDAQHDDGGWSDSADKDAKNDRTRRPNNNASTIVVMALREAHYAGFKADMRMWYKAAGYFREAQARDGGFRAMWDQYGGLGEPTTTHMTALGLTGLLATLDMGFAVDSARCDQYLANSAHIKKMNMALDWLDRYYDEHYKKITSLDEGIDPFFHANAMNDLIELSGTTRFNGKAIFRTEAEHVFDPDGRQYFDPGSGFFAGSLELSAFALNFFTKGAAPIAFQRCIVGGRREHEYSRDGDHLVRYLRSQRKEPVNWRDVSIDRSISDMVGAPILYINVVGPMEFEDADWRMLRDYCFGGGVVLINVAEGGEAERATIEKGLTAAFPEYALTALPDDDPILKAKHEIKPIPDMRVIGNGMKNLVFLTPQDWSCRLNGYLVEAHAETFQFIDNLLAYTLDGDPPRGSFLPSTWIEGTVSNMSVDIAHLQVGSPTPALPDLLETLDRAMRSEYRLKVNEVNLGDGGKPDLLWLSCAGEAPMTDEQRKQVSTAIDNGAFLFAEVLTGNANWAELFRADLQKLGGEIRIRKLLSNHPVMTGQFFETYGYDVRMVKLRRALREEYEKLPRVEMHVIERDNEPIGVLSVHDIGSGLGYMLYPNCRGVMPSDSRKLATNVVLYAMQRALR